MTSHKSFRRLCKPYSVINASYIRNTDFSHVMIPPATTLSVRRVVAGCFHIIVLNHNVFVQAFNALEDTVKMNQHFIDMALSSLFFISLPDISSSTNKSQWRNV
jgi:hypothetical protein